MFSRLPKIKAWVDEHNPGDPIIPFSVALEERLFNMASDEDRAEEEKAIGATSALGKITTAGYISLDVSLSPAHTLRGDDFLVTFGDLSLSDTSPRVLRRRERGQYEGGRRPHKRLVSSSKSSYATPVGGLCGMNGFQHGFRE